MESKSFDDHGKVVEVMNVTFWGNNTEKIKVDSETTKWTDIAGTHETTSGHTADGRYLKDVSILRRDK